MEVMEAIVHASDDEDGIDAQPHARLPQKSSQCPPAETQAFYEETSMLRPQQEQGASMPLSQIEQQQLSKSQATPPQYSQQQQQVSAAEMGAIRYEQQLYPALQGRQMNHSQQQQQLLLSPRQGLPQQQEHRPTSQTMPTVYQPQEPPQFLDQQQYTTPPPHRMPMIYSPHGSPQLHQQYISAPHGMPMVYSQQRQPLSSMLNSQTHQPQALVNSQLQFQHSTRFHSEPTDQLSRQPQQSSVVAHQQLHSRPLACPSVDPEESELAECNEVQAVDQELSTAESLPPTPQNMFKMKKQHRPDVWHFMRLVRKDSCSDIPVDKLRSEHAGAASCKLCGELVDYRVGATVPVRRHMELKHAEKLDEFNQKRVAAKRSAGGVLTLSRDGAICSMPSPETVVISAITPEQQAHANELLAVWIAKRLRPFSIVEDDEFVAYVTYLTEVLGGVRVKVPGRTRLREDIVLVASRLRAKLRNLIRRECRYFCVTTDIWTSMVADSYIALTLHYVTPDFRFRSWTLEVEPFPGRHSGEAIAAGLSKLFERWGLSSEYCVKLLRDGASNAVLAGELLNIEHMSCVAHSLHLVLAGVLVKRRRRRTCTTQSEQNLEQHHTTDLSPIPYQHFEHSSLAQRDANLVHDDSLGVSGTVGPADSTRFAAMEEDVYEDVVEADMWLQERAWEELDNFLRTWVSLEDAFALDTLRDTVQKFRDIAVYVHKSPKAKNWLQKTQRERMDVHPLRVIIDCPTRWNSARNMLARMIELNEPLALFFSFLKSPQGLVDFKDVKLTSPDPSDWFKVKCLISLLDPFAAVTEELSGGYPTLAMAVPFLRYIKRWLLRGDIFDETVALEGRHDYVDDTISLMKSIQRALRRLFDMRFNKLPSGALWVCLLDPRLTRMEALDEHEKVEAQELLLQATIEMATKMFPIPSPAHLRPSSSPVIRQSNKARSSIREGVFGKRTSRGPSQQVNSTMHADSLQLKSKAELHDYFIAAAAVEDEGYAVAKPLLWWKEKSAQFPILAQVARKWLGCVATSVPSERAFSTAGNIVAAKRSSLDPDIVRDLIFIHENYAKDVEKY